MARALDDPMATGDTGLSVQVGPMRRRHLRAVLQIEQQVYARPWSRTLFQRELGLRATRAYVVGRLGRRVVGYAGLTMADADGHVTTIAVDPHHRRRQIATRLLLALAYEARAREADQLTLEVRMSDQGAQDLYRRFGFESAGMREGYYSDTNEDALIMWSHDVRTDAYSERLADIEASIQGETHIESTRRS